MSVKEDMGDAGDKATRPFPVVQPSGTISLQARIDPNLYVRMNRHCSVARVTKRAFIEWAIKLALEAAVEQNERGAQS